MPRSARLDHPGALHHVMARGIERRRIFLDDDDRGRFLFRLGRVLADTGTRCFAFALMSNHYHLLLETAAAPLSRVMLRLGTCHAMDFNRRHRRCGHLFQNRFKSKIVEGDAGFLTVLRYVHLNPVRARMVRDVPTLAGWPWTGHAALMGRVRAPFLDADEVLAYFGRDLGEARTRLARWMAEGLEGTDGSVEDDPCAGCLPPVKAPGRPDLARLDRGSERAALRTDGWDLDRVIAIVCERLGAEEALLRAGRRTGSVSRAREATAWLAVERLGETQAAVARATGVSHQAVMTALGRGAAREQALRTRFPELVA